MPPQNSPTLPAWIVNAAPFIGLAKIRRLDLLTTSGRAVFLPKIVADEIEAGPAGDAAREALVNLDTRRIGILPVAALDPRLQTFKLDAGEAAVLTETLTRPGSIAVIDDGPGRRAGKALGIAIIESVGVLALARRQGRLFALAPELRALQAAGLYLPREDVLRSLLAGIGELWP